MKYNIGDIVYNTDGSIIEIIDREIIYNINMYYTSDNTSYPENKLFPRINIPKKKIDDFIKCFKPTELQSRTYKEYEKNNFIISNRIIYHFRKIIKYIFKSY